MNTKRTLLISSFLIIILLAVTAVSAADTNVTDDSTVNLASSDIDELAINEIDDAADSSLSVADTDNDLTNQSDEILEKSSEDALNMNSIEEDDTTVSSDDTSAVEVLTATPDDNVQIAGSNEITVLESDSDVDADKIIEGLHIIIDGIDVDFYRIIDDIINNIDIDVNVTGLLVNISDAFTLNRTAFIEAFDEFAGIFNISFNLTEKFSDFINNLDLNMTSEIEGIIDKINSSETFTFKEFYNLYDAISKTNDVGILTLIKAIGNVTAGLDIQKIIDVIKDPDFNFTNLINSLSLIIGSVTVNRTKILEEIDDSFGINVTKIENIISGIADIIDGIEFDTKNVISGLKTIFEGFYANNTKIADALAAIMDSISLNETALQNYFEDLLKEFDMSLKDFKIMAAEKINELVNYLDIRMNTKILADLIKLLSGNYEMGDVSKLIDDVMEYNDLTVSEVVDGIIHVVAGFNVSEIIDKITDPDFNITKVKDIISGIIDSITVTNMSKIYDGVIDIIKSIDYNMTYLYEGISTIFSGINYNFTTIINGLEKIIPKIDFEFFNFTDISKVIKFNKTNVIKGLKTILDGLSANTTKMYDGFLAIIGAISFNNTVLSDSLDAILKEFNMTKNHFFIEVLGKLVIVFKVLNPVITDEIQEELSKVYDGDNFNVTLFFKVLKEIYDYNNYTISNITQALGAVIDSINFTEIIYKITGPDFNFTNIANAISDVIDSTSINMTKAYEAITDIIGSIDFNITKIYDGLSYIFSGITYNFTGIFTAIENIISEIGKIIPEIHINCTDILKKVIQAMKDYLIVDTSSIVDGISEIIDGIKIDVSDIISGLADKLNITTERTPTEIVYKNMVTKTVNVKVDGKVGQYFAITLKDNKGNVLSNQQVQIGFNGQTYNLVTDKNGVAKLQINLPNAGTYTYSVCYLGDKKYSGSYVTSKVTVKKQTAKLTAKSKTTYKAKSKKKVLKATFKSAKGKAIAGKKITFKVKGKTYTGKTNKKGIAKVKVKLTKKGTFKVAVKFAGDNTYNKASKNIKLRIK